MARKVLISLSAVSEAPTIEEPGVETLCRALQIQHIRLIDTDRQLQHFNDSRENKLITLSETIGERKSRLFVIVLKLRVPVGAATFLRQIQHQPKRIEVWGTAGILSGVGHRTAHLTTVEVANCSVTPGENTEAWYVGVAGIDVGACVIA